MSSSAPPSIALVCTCEARIETDDRDLAERFWRLHEACPVVWRERWGLTAQPGDATSTTEIGFGFTRGDEGILRADR